MTTPTEPQYWVEKDGTVRGPYSFEILVVMWTRNELKLTDRLCKEGTDTWTDAACVMKSLEHAAHSRPEDSQNPPSFRAIMIPSAVLPIIGLIMGIVWLSQPRFRRAGGRVLAVGIVFSIIWYAVLAVLAT